MGIKGIFEQTILRGGFDLSEMLSRIDLYNVEAKLTDEERESLYALAREHAHPQYNYDSEIEAIWAAIRELQQGQQGGGAEPTDEWPEFKQPQGAHDAYFNGDKVTFEGARYICIAPDGTTCVWSPAAYPAFWEKQA